MPATFAHVLILALVASAVQAQTFDVTLKPVLDEARAVSAVEVRSTIDRAPPDSPPLTLTAPIVYAALRGVADRVTKLELRDAQGIVALDATDDPPVPGGFPYFRHWTPTRAVTYPVSITYTSLVQPPGSPNGPPFGIRPSGGGVSGAGSGFLVIPGNFEEITSTVRWDLSAFARGAAGVASRGEGEFSVHGSPALLYDSWYMAGPVERYPAEGEAGGFSASWLGQAPFDVAREMAWAAQLYRYLGEAFGYLDPAPEYRVFMRFLDTPPVGGGTALSRSFMYSRASAPFDPQAAGPREVLAHEMIHQWTGGIDAPDGVSSWFSEGLTTYYTALLPMRGGYMSVDDTAQAIDAMARGYWGSVARDWSAEKIAHAGFGDESIRHVPYNRSGLWFASLDARIRAKSAGRRTIDDFLRPIFESREHGVVFDHAAWKQALTAELGAGVAAEWERVILGGGMFVPEPNAFGPCFERVPKRYTVDGHDVEGYAWVRAAAVPDETCRRR